jgi:hypothetical protein
MMVMETVMETGDGRLVLYEVEICWICHDGMMQPRLIACPAMEARDKDCS